MTARRALATLVVVVALAACGGDDDGASDDTTGVVTATTAAATSTSTASTTTDTPGSTAPADPVALADVDVRLTEVATLDAPTALTARPGSDTLYVAEQAGRVRAVAPGDGQVTTALDIVSLTGSGGERGLLGLAFSADGATLFASYTNTDGDSRVDSFAMDGDVADPASRRQIFAADQPYPNHNGGALHRGPDGLLWLGLGDGGSGGDPENRAQDPTSPLGKILRIDPDAPDPAEIWALGLRNPWRFSFDRATGDLWIADVGQDEVEEIDLLPAGTPPGANLGWSGLEGTTVYDEERVPAEHVAPVHELFQSDGWCAIAGGVVARSDRLPELDGAYLFGDNCRTPVMAIRVEDGRVVDEADLGVEVEALVSIDQDADGNVWLLSLAGPVYRLDPA